MNTKAAKIYLKTPERKWLWRGGFAAVVLPLLSSIAIALFFMLADRVMGEGLDSQNVDYSPSLIFIKIIFLGSFYTFLLWGFLTLPLSLICGFVFWFVAVRGSENVMAETFD